MAESGQLVHIQNFIAGEFRQSSSHVDSFDPSTGEVWATVPDSGDAEVNDAVTAAQAAFKQWSTTPVQKRSDILLRIADILESRLEEFAVAESRDQGKPVWLSRTVDIPRAVYNFRCFATSVLHHVDTSTYLDGVGAINYTSRSPVGVAALISPWNLPLYLLTFKIAPAIATGNTVVCKPSEFTSVTAWMLCSVFQTAGLPSGVVNMVFGVGQKAGQALVSHPFTALVSFTGGTVTAEKIRQASARSCKKLSLELGGKNAAVIFDDVDIEKCVATTIRSSFMNQGEVCLCTSRLFIQSAIFNTFLQKFLDETRNIKVGDPTSADTWMGALISQEHLTKVKSYVQIAKEEGCIIQCGEGVDPLELANSKLKQGYFMRPTVITNVKDTSRLMQEEIFGPVVCLVPFDNEDEVIGRANNIQYGLCATVWSKDVGRIHRVARNLQVGTVWANCWLVRDLHMPFGGVKSSGVGREGVVESLEFYTDVKTVCIQIAT